MRKAMACPQCGERMVAGSLRVKGTLAGTLLVGWRWQHLWWSDPDNSRESRRKVIPSDGVVEAAMCASCETIAFVPTGD